MKTLQWSLDSNNRPMKEEEQPDSNQTPKPEPEPTEKQSVTALLRAEIEKRSLRIEEMRKALNEAIQEVQP